MLDWDSIGRTQTVDVLDGSTNAVLDTRNVASFSSGQYWVWSLSGHVVLKFTNTGGSSRNAVINGIFFDGATGGGGSDYITNYSYDSLGHLKTVTMPRPSGTQTRTFNYGTPPGALLLSSTNPESGTVTYTYNPDHTLATKTDAKNQQVQYSYDSLKRVTEIRRGFYSGSFIEDTCQREDYTYDAGTYGQGRLTGLQYKGGLYYLYGSPGCDHTFTESFTYNSPGGITSQGFAVSEPARNYSAGGNISATLTASYTYDNEGRITATQYPSYWNGSSWVAGPNLGNTFDSMGRLQKLTDLAASSDIISNATYGAAGQLLTMTGNGGAPSETRTYNSIGQMTQLQSGSLNIQYAYSATQNNGKIVSQKDMTNSEEVDYFYDSLNRLAKAETKTDPSVTQWGQSYTYDGFGNLTNVATTKGSTPNLVTTYDPATNRQTGECADANGNINASTPTCGAGYIYDVENRIVAQTSVYLGAQPTFAYSYKPGNKRIWKGISYVYDGTSMSLPTSEELTFWSTSGQKLETYSLTQYQPGGPNTLPQLVATQTGTNYYFGGKLVKNTGGYVTPDRLGSIGKYFPYGQERPSPTTDGKEKFATYFRDSETGLDYANNRYHQPGMGRFLTPDPSHTANPKDPNSWNQYAYAGGDPVNNADPKGLDWGCGDTFCEDPLGGYGSLISCIGQTGSADACYAALTAFESNGECQVVGSVFAYDLGCATSANFLTFNPSLLPPDIATRDIVNAGMPIAQNALSAPSCAGLFHLPGGASPWSLMSQINIIYEPTNTPNYYAFTYGPDTEGNPTPGHYTIIFNTDPGNPNITDAAGAAAASETIIHELLHVAYDMYGPGAVIAGWINNDYGTGPFFDSAEENNNGIVHSNCAP